MAGTKSRIDVIQSALFNGAIKRDSRPNNAANYTEIFHFGVRPLLHFGVRSLLHFDVGSLLHFDVRFLLHFDVRFLLHFDFNLKVKDFGLNVPISDVLDTLLLDRLRILLRSDITTNNNLHFEKHVIVYYKRLILYIKGVIEKTSLEQDQ
jgi:hypothetical protein